MFQRFDNIGYIIYERELYNEVYNFFNENEYLDEYVGKHIVDFISNHNQPVIGFATGSTPLGIYDYFIKEYKF